MSNIQASAQRLLVQRAGSWWNTLNQVRDRVQSVTPAIPNLLSTAMVELTVTNRTGKQNDVNSVRENARESLATEDEGREIQDEDNHCEYIERVDVSSSQMSASEYSSDDVCDEKTTCGSTKLTDELSTKLLKVCVYDSSLPNDVCDQDCVDSIEFGAKQNNILSEVRTWLTAENNIDVSRGETSACNSEENTLSTEDEAQFYSDMLISQSVIASALTETRTFSVDVSESPEIIYSSSRKKKKSSVKQGICMSLYLSCSSRCDIMHLCWSALVK